MSAKVVTLIETDIELRGDGSEGNPYRRVRQWWTTEGELVVSLDVANVPTTKHAKRYHCARCGQPYTEHMFNPGRCAFEECHCPRAKE